MGGWTLEIARMALYLTFPVVAFHFFNSPEYFEKYVIEKKREMYPHENDIHREEVMQLMKDINSGNIGNKMKQLQKLETERTHRQEAAAAAAVAGN